MFPEGTKVRITQTAYRGQNGIVVEDCGNLRRVRLYDGKNITFALPDLEIRPC